MTAVVFDPTVWRNQYPQFDAVTDVSANGYFNIATLYLDNGDCSIVQDVTQRSTLLGLLTAHIATLNGAGTASGAPSGLVGRITSATEGSVSVQTSYPDPKSALEGWLNQTTYGAMFWAATGYLRMFRYVPAQPCIPYGVRRLGWR
jgi:hypothetical protein